MGLGAASLLGVRSLFTNLMPGNECLSESLALSLVTALSSQDCSKWLHQARGVLVLKAARGTLCSVFRAIAQLWLSMLPVKHGGAVGTSSTCFYWCMVIFHSGGMCCYIFVHVEIIFALTFHKTPSVSAAPFHVLGNLGIFGRKRKTEMSKKSTCIYLISVVWS